MMMALLIPARQGISGCSSNAGYYITGDSLSTKCPTSSVSSVSLWNISSSSELVVAYRKPFVPPSASSPLVVRSITYGGEDHPATLKRAITVPISRLPLKDKSAVHKFKLLAGPRWTLEPPANSGIAPLEEDKEHGYFTVSCEDFPMAAQNMKWASDVLDRLLTEANVSCRNSVVSMSPHFCPTEHKRQLRGRSS